MAVLGNYLVVKCEKCGKKYGTSAENLKQKEVTFPCKDCGATVTAIRPDTVKKTEKEEIPVAVIPDRAGRSSSQSFLQLGLTGKFLLFTILPLIVVSVIVVLVADNRMRGLQRQTINSSTEVVQNISENLILQISETVARQARQYLFSHPDLRKENFNRDIYFKKVVLQKIGVTGSTALYEIAGDKGAWLTWADVDPSMVGKDMVLVKDKLGADFDQYWKIITGVSDGRISSGVHKWPDSKGNLRDKFVVCTPLEGTPFVISASIFLDEITAPLKTIEAKGYEVAGQIRITLMIVLGGGLLMIFLILLFYGQALRKRIKGLADWADAISLGQMHSQPEELYAKDEIGDLTEAIGRMQESIRLSMERLQRRRG